MKVSVQRDPDGFVRFNCPQAGCGKRFKLQTATGGKVTCSNPRCGFRFEVIIAGQPPRERSPRPRPQIEPPPPRKAPKARPLWRHPASLVVAGVVLLGAVAGGIFVFTQPDSDRPTPTPNAGLNPGDRPGGPTSSPNERPPTVQAQPGATAKEVETLPPVTVPSQDIAVALREGLKITGTLQVESVSESIGLDTRTFQKWKADLKLDNQSSIPATLGPDLLLIETSADGRSYEGFGVFGIRAPITGPESYGLTNNYELAGNRINKGGGRYTVSYFGWGGESLGAVLKDKPWTLDREFPQHSWLLNPAEACLVLPELRINTQSGVDRFRLLGFFAKSGTGRSWALREQRLIPMQAAELQKMLTGPGSTLVTQVLAANWLAELHPETATQTLVAAASPAREGQLLATCLLLLTNLKGPGLAGHALDLLQDAKLPNGIRSMAAEYLGVIRHGPALEPLVNATTDRDPTVAQSAISGLGAFGGERAVKVLTDILRDKQRPQERRVAADALGQTGDPTAIGVLKDEVTAGNDDALQSLAAAGIPETFDFFVGLADTVTVPQQRDVVARGVKNTGGDQALPVLLRMIEKAPPAEDAFYGDGLTGVLVELNAPKATPDLTRLAQAGNLRAAWVLAGSKNDTVQTPLTELAKTADGAILRRVLSALVDRWAADNVDTFAAALKNDDTEVVQTAIRGLQQSKSPKAMGLLIPLLEHANQNVRQGASWSVEQVATGDGVDQLSAVLLRSDDPTVIRACARILIKQNWKGQALIPKIGEKLQTSKEFAQYDLVRLLRHLSGDAMGPSNDSEWYKDREGWVKKWADWAAQQ